MKAKWLSAFAVLLMLLAGYKGYDYHNRHSEAALLARAHDYWEAFRINDLVTAYHLEAEAASGQLAPHEVELRQDWNMRLVSFKLGQVTYYGDHAEIEMQREFTLPDGIGTFPSASKDLWTFVNGQWYHGSPEKGGALIRKKAK